MSDFIYTVKVKIEDAPDSRWGRKIIPYNEREFRHLLLRFDPGTDALFAAKKFRAKHSASARGYLHGVVLPMIGEASGEDDMRYLYQKMKEKFHHKVVIGKEGQEEFWAESLAESDTKEMADFIDKVMRWGETFFGINFPPPQRVMQGGGGI